MVRITTIPGNLPTAQDRVEDLGFEKDLAFLPKKPEDLEHGCVIIQRVS